MAVLDIVNGIRAHANGGANAVSGALTITAGNTILVVAMDYYGPASNSVTDDQGNTYVRIDTSVDPTWSCFAASNCAAGSTTVTFHQGSGRTCYMFLVEIEAAGQTLVREAGGVWSGNSGTYLGSPVTTKTTAQVWLAIAQGTFAGAPSAPFNLLGAELDGDNYDFVSIYLARSAANSYSVTGAVSGGAPWFVQGIAVAEPGGAGTSIECQAFLPWVRNTNAINIGY